LSFIAVSHINASSSPKIHLCSFIPSLFFLPFSQNLELASIPTRNKFSSFRKVKGTIKRDYEKANMGLFLAGGSLLEGGGKKGCGCGLDMQCSPKGSCVKGLNSADRF
jgi:hypothetical protein